jgi:hypothetical protein
MSTFTPNELTYLSEQRIGQLDTVDRNGGPTSSRPGSTSMARGALGRSAGTSTLTAARNGCTSLTSLPTPTQPWSSTTSSSIHGPLGPSRWVARR